MTPSLPPGPSVQPPAGSSPGLPRPLLVTGSAELLDDLLRLAVVAGVEAEVAVDPGAARRPWAGAPLVLVGDDQAAALARAGLPRRPDVVLVGGDLDDAGVWPRAVAVGAEHVVILPDGETWLIERLAAATEPPARASVVGVVGGRGGAGATTLAAALGVVAARRRLACLLLDADPLGGGVDLILGAEEAAGLRWSDLTGSRGRVSAAALVEALPAVDGLHLLAWDRDVGPSVGAEAMTAVMGAGVRASDLVVVDLPRHLGPAGEAALSRVDVVYLVVPAEVRAVASAGRVAAGVGLLAGDVRLVVRGPAPTGLPAEVVAESLGLPLAGWLRPEPGLSVDLDRGERPAARSRGPLARLAGALLDDVLRPGRRVA